MSMMISMRADDRVCGETDICNLMGIEAPKRRKPCLRIADYAKLRKIAQSGILPDGEMDLARIRVLAITAALVLLLGITSARAQNAYITNAGAGTVSVINTATGTVIGSPITVGTHPYGVAVTPDGSKVYVTNANSGTVSVIATASNTVIGSSITVGTAPEGVAVTPDGSHVYIANFGSNTVSVIGTASNTVIGSPITVGGNPVGVAVTPDGSKVYVANANSGTISVIATATNTVVGSSITVGTGPQGVAVSPDGSKVYVANLGSGTVSVIATASNTVVGSPITVGSQPIGVAVSPDGSKVYVTNLNSNTVSVIATASNTVAGSPITVGSGPVGVAVSPDGSKVYVANNGDGTVSVIATASNTVGSPITVGSGPIAFGNFIGLPTLTVADAGSGSGQVTSSPAGINCGAGGNQCTAMFPEGTQVTLTALASAGSTFAGWSGGGCSGTGTCVITPATNTTVTATFNPPVTLTVTEPGSGSGQVSSSPAGINCSASSNLCAAPFAVGTQVNLTASASAGSSFAGWSGGGCSGTGTCQVTMSAAQSVTATFNIIPSFMLSVVPSGTGAGTVTSTPSGIACGATCNASFQQGTQVTLTAAAASGSTFAGWSGAGCSGDQSCTVTLGANTTVNARFVADAAANLTLVAAVLPLSRSVEVGNTATAFATMIDAGPADASTCTIAPATGIPASFVFQTTDPTTNGLTGSANTPANIAAGQAQSFVIALTPTASFPPTNVVFTFTCADAPSPAATTIGVNTLNLSGSTTPVPDIVALAASADPGFVDIPGATGTGVFAVATVNVGADATITASANTGTANLPVTLTICQTNPQSGACLATPTSSVATDIQPNATPTFGIFVTGSAAVANLPGVNRVFVTFTDGNGVLRGETSVAVRTQ
jgi:YVTN family beta-propeller protein